MVRPVEDSHPEVDHRIARQVAARARVLNAFLHRRHELPRDSAAEDVVDELEVAPARQRLDLDLAVAELPVASGLLLVAAVRLCRGRDRFTVGDARQLQIHLDAEPALQLGDRDLDVELSLPGEEQLFGLRVARVV